MIQLIQLKLIHSIIKFINLSNRQSLFNRLWNYLINNYILLKSPACPSKDVSPSMDLNAFPDTVLRAVFDRVPLSDLIRRIPLVCHRWYSLQPSVLLSKKSVSVTIQLGLCVSSSQYDLAVGKSIISILHEDELTNEDGSRMFPSPMDDLRMALTLNLTTFTPELVDGLIAKLQKVTYFKLYYFRSVFQQPPVGHPEPIPLIARLLDHWGSSLVTLKLHCRFTSVFEANQQLATTVASQMVRLFETVNTLPLLEHLTLDLLADLRTVKSLDLPILGRLKEFFSDNCPIDFILSSLDRFAEPNDQLRSIGLGNWVSMAEYFNEFSQSHLDKRFTMLPRLSFGSQTNLAEFERFVSTFSNLTCFSGYMKDLNLTRLTVSLAPLTRLIHLTLYGSEFQITNADNAVSFRSYDDEPADQIHPLTSVKVLTVWITTRAHTDLASRHWARMFPNLQFIHLIQRTEGCRTCNFENDQSEKVAPCVQQTLLPFKQAFRSTLKKVYYCRNNDYENLKVFTPDTILDVDRSEDDA